MFNDLQKQKLRDLSYIPPGVTLDFKNPNERLENYIIKLQEENPALFHAPQTLKERVFIDEPRTVFNYKRYIRTRAESPINIVPIS